MDEFFFTKPGTGYLDMRLQKLTNLEIITLRKNMRRLRNNRSVDFHTKIRDPLAEGYKDRTTRYKKEICG